MRLAIAMIVKNEEAHLERCLKSVSGLAPIYILDTGSTDKTCEIARKYTDKVFENEYKWKDSFADARNYIKEKCDADWILSIDADEYLLTPHAEILEAIEDAQQRGYKTIDIILRGEGTNNDHRFPRIFRHSCTWKGAIHNYLDTEENNCEDIVIVYGYSEAHKQDPDRAFRILSKEVMLPGRKRELFYLAREYWYRHDYPKAIEWYNKYLDVAWWVPEMADAYLMMARCYVRLGEYGLARKSCVQAINLNADFKEALNLMGDLTGPKNSAKWYKWAFEASNRDVLFVNDIRSYREMQLIENIPDVFDYASVLYVGASCDRQQMLKDFRNRNFIIDIVEPFKDNYEYCKLIPGIRKVYDDTIQLYASRTENYKQYDVVFWWHGPEHISDKEVERTFNQIEAMATKLVVLGCPWGKYEQGPIKGNIYEIHKTDWDVKDFESMGYKTSTLGQKDVSGSNLLAWKKIKE